MDTTAVVFARGEDRTDSIETREAYASEREAVIELTLAAYEQYDATMPPGAWSVYADSIRATLRDPASGALIIAVEGATLVGSALLVPPQLNPPPGRAAQPYPEIRLVATAPAARRRGIGTAVVNACIQRSRAEGYRTVGLHSTQYMADAIRIYERLGFVRATEHDFQTPGGVLVMGFRLDLLEFETGL
jgi:GNAT superfamily N-acetyltransferase